MFFTPRCPVVPAEQEWIETSLRWCADEFGDAALRGPVQLPTADFLPDGYNGDERSVRALLDLMCGHLAVDSRLVDLDLLPEEGEAELLANLPAYERSYSGAAGHYQQRGEKAVITISASTARQPVDLIATIAHELCHVRLLGERRISVLRQDHEPLTDLLTVFLGMGIFSANASFETAQAATGYSARRLGYLTEPMFGYALAGYAWLRGETKPEWAPHLDTNPRAFMRKGLRYLRSVAAPGELPRQVAG